MMNQWSMFNFAIIKNDGKNQYVFQLQPGSSWDEIQLVLEEFKTEFKQLQQQLVQQEAEKKAAEESSAG
jgi:hypothetical protein